MVGGFLTEALLFGMREQGASAQSVTLLVRSPANPNLAAVEQFPESEVLVADLAHWKPDRDFDYVFHAASPASPTQYGDVAAVVDSNLGFATTLVSEAPRFGRILFVSSGEVYGAAPPSPVPETYIGNPDTALDRAVYGVSKMRTERLLLDNVASTRVARLHHTFGPGMREHDGRSFADFIWAAARGEDLVLRSPGADARTFLYSADAVRGMFDITLSSSGDRVFNLGSDEPMTIRRFAETVSEVSGVGVRFPDDQLHDGYEHSPIQQLVPDLGRLRSLGWAPRVGVREAVRRTLQWVRGVREPKERSE